MKILVTGSGGLVGSEAAEHFAKAGYEVVGVDNNMRADFFGSAGDVSWRVEQLRSSVPGYKHYSGVDVRSLAAVESVFSERGPFDAVVHCAAQPSHDKAREIPLVDHAVNATGTLNLLEATRRHSPEAVFVFMSTNKVYGDAPNEMEFHEYDTRYDWFPEEWQGFDESTRVDQSTHSVFGASKLAADVMVQEYARTYGMRTAVLRGGCLTGPAHSGVELHGFLSYLAKCCSSGKKYKVYGYKGKQVRDNIHSADVVRAIERIISAPRPGEVYNIGGGRENSVSMIEAIRLVEAASGKELSWEYVDEARLGDHKCWITDMSKFKSHYPGWDVTRLVPSIVAEMV